MKTAAIYARVSSERQKEEQTITSQIAALIEYAKQEGYTVPVEWIFQDEGYSGTTLVRPGLEQARDLAAEGQIENILIHSPDRLSRKYAYQVLLVEEFARHGVEIVFVKSPQVRTPEDQLLLQFQGMIAEYERAQIAERTRRGKRHRAKSGCINVLSGAPYGYRYIKKTETSDAYYELIAHEADTVRHLFELYTNNGFSIGAITAWLNENDIPTRKKKSRWERSTVWAMLRNPAYKGTACFGKTEATPRQRITRPLRQQGGFSPRCSSNRQRPREEWIEIAVPRIISDEVFAVAEERLEDNKRFSPRRTIEPTLLQSMLVCGECGYAYYRTSTRTSKRKIYYYRCLGSDDYRHVNGRLCQNKPIRQDYLDEIIWEQVIRLLENPDLIRHEIGQRIKKIQNSNPTKKRKDVLDKEIRRQQKGIEKLLDAYQEGLLELDELRNRLPGLRKRKEALLSEKRNLEATFADRQTFLRLADNIENFLERIRSRADTLEVLERQKILRLVVKEILVYENTIKIRHLIPITQTSSPSGLPGSGNLSTGYLLRSWRDYALAQQLIGDSFRESLGEGQRYTDHRMRLIEEFGVITPRGLSKKDGVSTAMISQWLKPLIEKGILSWCDEKGDGFNDVANREKAKRSGRAYLKVAGGCRLPSVFELTGDTRWDIGGELYVAYDLHLDADPVENVIYPDEQTVVDQDIIFDDDSVTLGNKSGVKVLSDKAHSEVLKMVDDFRKSEHAKGSNDAANINLGKEFSKILSPDGYGMVI